jgi:hypothetical protein
MKQIKRMTLRFKEYVQNQVMMIPPTLDEMIEANHPVRIVNSKTDPDATFMRMKEDHMLNRSESNYLFLEENLIRAFVKGNYFDIEAGLISIHHALKRWSVKVISSHLYEHISPVVA